VTNVVLQGTLGYTVSDGPQGFETPLAAGVDSAPEDEAIKGFVSARCIFGITFERDPSYVVGTYVLVGWAFNMVGFLVFWIPVEGTGMDRSGLAITTILAAQFMMYDAKVTTESTWLDFYFACMLCFQFFSFLLTVHSARMNRYTVAHGGDDEYLTRVFAYQKMTRRRSRVHNVSFFIFNLIYGGLDAFWIDRWARRLLLPSFFAVQMAICFFPRSGQASVAASDHTGIRAPLFGLNLFFFALYAVVFVLGYGLGFVYDDRMDTLRKRHIHDVEATSLENLYSAISLEFAARVGETSMLKPENKLRRGFLKWKEAARLASDTVYSPSSPMAHAAPLESFSARGGVDLDDDDVVSGAERNESYLFCGAASVPYAHVSG